MTNIRRYFEPNHLCFMTHVTYKRKPILIENIDFLLTAIEEVKSDTQFSIIAWVVLPDHFHMIIDPKLSDISQIIRRVKLKFSSAYRKHHKMVRGRVWQYRFWDHMIKGQNDLNTHMDYIHFNPVKHGLVDDPFAYDHSSLGDYVDAYSEDWGIKYVERGNGEFGE